MGSYSRFGAVLLICLVVIGCPKRIVLRPVEKERAQTAIRALNAQSEQRRQMTGLFVLKGMFTKQLLGSAEFDFIAQKPNRLYLSQRSFFEQPLRVMATDGARVDLLDLTDISLPRFESHPVVNGKLPLWDLPITPSELVQILLNAFNPEGFESVDVMVAEDSGEFHVFFKQGQTNIEVVMSSKLGMTQITKKIANDLIYRVDFDDFRDALGQKLAHRLLIHAPVDGFERELTLVAKTLELNGPMAKKEVFQLKPLD